MVWLIHLPLQGANRHWYKEHPELEAKHIAEQAQSSSQDRPTSPNLPESSAQESIPGSSANVEDRLASALQEEGFGRTPSHNQQLLADDLIDPRLLGPNSLGKRRPLTPRQQVRYRMLYTA